MKKVLIVEDNKDISNMLENFLSGHDYEVECAYEGRSASKCISDQEYDIILMDLMLPHKSGDAIIRELREHSDTPVICLSAKSGMDTRLEVLRMGADDYILKPFDLNEVLVRLEVVLRRSGRSGQALGDDCGVLTIGDIVLIPKENRVEYDGKNIPLTSKELQILKLMMEQPTKTFTKANLYESVWNDTYYYEDNTINVHVSNLRSKLKKATGSDYIETVWGIGYRMRES
ncbi:MAG: response regulator transcription factor [Clostridium sp.]|nr:response regulator transcription factor [Clostridium sp.]MCM1399448.1 response regulator transcription factor [Clostridium sp.]MCM1460002.1 response regulator transcription factor [Bacteroides sp.]